MLYGPLPIRQVLRYRSRSRSRSTLTMHVNAKSGRDRSESDLCVFVGSSQGTGAQNSSGQVLRKPLGSSEAAGSAVVSTCPEVRVPVRQSGCVSGVGSGGLCSTDVGVQRAWNDLRVRDTGATLIEVLQGTGEKLCGWPEGTEVDVSQ